MRTGVRREPEFVEVYCDGERVGTNAAMRTGLCAFEYAEGWINNGFPISPLSLPLQKGVFVPKQAALFDFDGLFGIFDDSLPDGWGRLLMDRKLRSNGIEPDTAGGLYRLALVGTGGMGALEYRPDWSQGADTDIADFDALATEIEQITSEQDATDLNRLYRLGGSSSGARPKAMVSIDGVPMIVKFPTSSDSKDIGEMEYRYMLCAAACGISTPACKLLPSHLCKGYYAVECFDETRGARS